MINTILIRPVITEKSIDHTKNKFYTFEVEKTASKHQIKEQVEKLFSVTVSTVKTINRAGKIKRTGRMRKEKTMSNRRYARVKIGKDQNIELFSVVPEETKK